MLADFLRIQASFATTPDGYTYSGLADFVLDRGEAFASKALDEEQRAFVQKLGGYWKQRECFYNGQLLSLMHPERLTYVEGYAHGAAVIPVHHGWCVLDGTHVIDLTWRRNPLNPRTARVKGEIPEGWEYLGVRFPHEEYDHRARAWRLKSWMSYLDAFDDASLALYKQPRRSPPCAKVEVLRDIRKGLDLIYKEDASCP